MGGKKGGGGHTPYEAPDNLKSAQRLSAIGLISLGPIRGAVTADQYQSAFFDYTPIKNSKGEWNYQNTLIRYRLGYQDQQPLEDFDASEREVSVGAEVKTEHPLSRAVIDPDIDLLRITLGVNALFSQNDQGDTHGTSVHLEILINGQSRQTVVINGKSSSRFHRSYLIDNLPPRPFTVTVQRVTPDSKSQRLQNATFWSSYTEIISTKLSYPNMAIVGIKTDSRYNPNFPNINFLLYGRLVKVPSNYDPDTRTYGSGLWRGDFKLAWTNNPAWVFYDLVTNKLAGLGQRLGDYGIDKFQLYQIAQYCDQQVPDGYGGVEPRMVANLWLTEQRDAYSVISDMASVFRAIVVWNGTQLTAIQDRNADPVCSFTQANVIDGKFNRQYVPLKSIFTAVEVEYADERNNYQKAIEYVADDVMIKRYGYNVKKIVAFACTSRGQARRYGKWVLETSRLEQCTISFSVGREGLQVLPGDIIEIADKSYANVNLGGRVLAINGRTVTLDAPIEVQGEKHLSYLVNDNNGQRLVRRKISQINAQNKSLVTLDSEPTGLQVMDTWALHTQLVSTQRYRVLGVAENEDGSYGITALQHEPQKERIVDEGAFFEPQETTLHRPPQITYLDVTTGFDGKLHVSAETSSGNGTVTYDIKILKEGALFRLEKNLSSPTFSMDELPNGEYLLIIYAKNERGQLVSEKSQSFTIDKPPTPTNVVISGGLGEIILEWDWINEATQTEIFVAETDDFSQAKRLTKVSARTYAHAVGAKQVRYYWLRHVRGMNNGPFYQEQGVRGESAVDIASEIQAIQEELESSEWIKSLTSDAAVDALNKSGLSNLRSETTKLMEQLQNDIRNCGTAIEQLKNVDAQQAQQFATITAKAENALSGLSEEQKARANGDKTNADKITLLTSRIGSAESNISNMQSTKADKTEIASVAQTALQSIWKSDIKSGVDGLQIGGRNLLLNSKQERTTIGTTSFSLSQNIDYANVSALVVSCDVAYNNATRATTTGAKWFRIGVEVRLNYTDGTYQFFSAWKFATQESTNFTGRISSKIAIPANKTLRLINSAKIQIWDIAAQSILVKNPKLEIGNSATDWSPAPEDLERTINDVSAEFNSYKATQAGIDLAQSEKTELLTSKVGEAEVALSTTSQTLATIDGKVNAMHTIKTVAVAGGKKAISGISMGTNGEESSVILMADKFQVIKNAQDATPKAMLTVVDNKVAINGDLIADGSIAAQHLAANSVNASHIASKAISTDKLNVNSLSAISANLGSVTAGRISGVTIEGNNISGGTISGTTISGGTIKGARLEAVTGKFTGELEVTQLIGGNIFNSIGVIGKFVERYFFRTAYTPERGSNGGSGTQYTRHDFDIYQRKIMIKSSPVNRIVNIISSEKVKFNSAPNKLNITSYDSMGLYITGVTQNSHGQIIIAKNTAPVLNIVYLRKVESVIAAKPPEISVATINLTILSDTKEYEYLN